MSLCPSMFLCHLKLVINVMQYIRSYSFSSIGILSRLLNCILSMVGCIKNDRIVRCLIECMNMNCEQ